MPTNARPVEDGALVRGRPAPPHARSRITGSMGDHAFSSSSGRRRRTAVRRPAVTTRSVSRKAASSADGHQVAEGGHVERHHGGPRRRVPRRISNGDAPQGGSGDARAAAAQDDRWRSSHLLQTARRSVRRAANRTRADHVSWAATGSVPTQVAPRAPRRTADPSEPRREPSPHPAPCSPAAVPPPRRRVAPGARVDCRRDPQVEAGSPPRTGAGCPGVRAFDASPVPASPATTLRVADLRAARSRARARHPHVQRAESTPDRAANETTAAARLLHRPRRRAIRPDCGRIRTKRADAVQASSDTGVAGDALGVRTPDRTPRTLRPPRLAATMPGKSRRRPERLSRSGRRCSPRCACRWGWRRSSR